MGALEKYYWTLSLEAFLPFTAAEGLELSHEQILALRVGYRITSWIQFLHSKERGTRLPLIFNNTRVMICCSATNIEKRFPSSINIGKRNKKVMGFLTYFR